MSGMFDVPPPYVKPSWWTVLKIYLSDPDERRVFNFGTRPSRQFRMPWSLRPSVRMMRESGWIK